jgi:hypothetical protein
MLSALLVAAIVEDSVLLSNGAILRRGPQLPNIGLLRARFGWRVIMAVRIRVKNYMLYIQHTVITPCILICTH